MFSIDREILPDWVSALPDWVHDSEVRWLSRRPWLAGFIRAEDYSLKPAEERFARSQRYLRHTLRRAVANAGARELIAVRGDDVETTAFRFTPPATSGVGVTRGVRVEAADASMFEGLAVPYNQRSEIIQVRDVLAYEMFDRQSFEPLPPSCPLREQHDYSIPAIGRVTSLRHHSKQGLLIEAELDEKGRTTWIRRWARGEFCSLSVTFAAAPISDQWTVTHDGHPLRTVRRAQLVDVAVVRIPAYPTARITRVFRGQDGLSQRSRRQT